MVVLGVFLLVAGTYATVQLIVDAYAAGTIGKFTKLVVVEMPADMYFAGSAFSCADNSNSS